MITKIKDDWYLDISQISCLYWADISDCYIFYVNGNEYTCSKEDGELLIAEINKWIYFLNTKAK